ncbi:MAG: erythromycin esterase family protein [Polyangiaceae bacterium]|nr:erythromycin esterase family protein [Polyangiaceae bacterium]
MGIDGSLIRYLDRVDRVAADRARRAYECFARYGREAQAYAQMIALSPASCEEEVVRALVDLRESAPKTDGRKREDFFRAEQNAIVAQNAELYYRTMVRGGASSWNVRDEHMADTLDRLVEFYGPASKAIVWAHNTHVGDARYTDNGRDRGAQPRTARARATYADIPIGNQGDDATAFIDHRRATKILVPHDPRCIRERILRSAGRDDVPHFL